MSDGPPPRRTCDPRSLLSGDAATAARRLLGATLHSTVGGRPTAGVIVETEAYLGRDDPASHAWKGRTRRNDAMFGPAGTLYVYVSHGIHHCANVVTGARGDAAAVLIRALDPTVGTEVMAVRRGRTSDLCSGPGRLAQALGITMDHNRHDLAAPPVELRLNGVPAADIGTSGRIGVSRAARLPLRFFVRGHRAVKSPRW